METESLRILKAWYQRPDYGIAKHLDDLAAQTGLTRPATPTILDETESPAVARMQMPTHVTGPVLTLAMFGEFEIAVTNDEGVLETQSLPILHRYGAAATPGRPTDDRIVDASLTYRAVKRSVTDFVRHAHGLGAHMQAGIVVYRHTGYRRLKLFAPQDTPELVNAIELSFHVAEVIPYPD